MSVKAMSLVWDFECPLMVNGTLFRPNHKYILLAYADHADHQGKNIWPAVPTIARKTGFQDRSIQRLTDDLEAMGLLIEDGQGPRGTNKWRLALNERGDSLSPVTHCRGDSSDKSLGDSASGDSASGDSLSPEFKEPEPNLNKIPEERFWEMALQQLKIDMPRSTFDAWVRDTNVVSFDGATLAIGTSNAYARDWLENRIASTVTRLMVGIMNQSVAIKFVVSAESEGE
jgi:ATPase involved in DNA replication initiation